MDWRLMQLADSAFPTGGFAHSAGLEAALQQGEVRGAEGLERFATESLWQAGQGMLPWANGAYADPLALAGLDARCDAFLSNHVANRASRVQGRTFLATCLRAIATEELRRVAESARELNQHFAPLFGASLRALGVEREPMQRLLLFTSLRGVISAAIRLGVIGPYQAQRMQWAFAHRLDEVLAHCASLSAEDAAQTAPLIDLFQGNHDRLYSRLFQS